MGKSHKEFEALVAKLLKDGLLQNKDWETLVHVAESHGLAVEQAERIFLQEAVRRGAPVEKLELAKLEDLARIAAVGGVLDPATHDWITAKRAVFAATFATPPPAIENVRARDEVEHEIAARLARHAGPSKTLSPSEWRGFYHDTLRALALGEGGEDDCVDLFLACRKQLGIMIQDGVSPPSTPPTPIPIGSIAALTVAVAVIVFFLILYVQSMME